MPSRRMPQARRIGDLVGRIVDPVAAKRGFSTADLISSWPDVVGPQLADVTRPDQIVWPPRDPDAPGALVLTVDGPTAVLVQHQADQIVERVNAFMGYRAIARIRFRQGPVGRTESGNRRRGTALAPEAERTLDAALEPVADDRLKTALARLGRGVLSETK